MTYYDSSGLPIEFGRKIGAGGQGAVYSVLGNDEVLAKVYFEAPTADTIEKLEILSKLTTPRLSAISAWPVSVLYDAPQNGRAIGFLMTRVIDAEEVHALNTPKSRLQKFPEATWRFLIHASTNFARAVNVIHEHGIVIGDINPRNILVTRKGTIHLLDSDSFQVRFNGKVYRCGGGFGEYTPPELQGSSFKDVDRYFVHDYFGLAIVIFQLLFIGRHPYSGRHQGYGDLSLEEAIRRKLFAYAGNGSLTPTVQPPGSLSLNALPEEIGQLFKRAFMSEDAANRPNPQEWVESLTKLSESLKQCAIHSGHVYYDQLSNCPWCEIEMQVNTSLFNFTMNGVVSEGGDFKLDELWKEIESLKLPDLPIATNNSIILSADALRLLKIKARCHVGSIICSLIFGFIIIGLTPTLGFGALMLMGGAFLLVRKINNLMDDDFTRWIISMLFRIPVDTISSEVGNRYTEEVRRLDSLKSRWNSRIKSDEFIRRLDYLEEKANEYERIKYIRNTTQNNFEDDWKNTAKLKTLDDDLNRLRYEIENGAHVLKRLKHMAKESVRELRPAIQRANYIVEQASVEFEVINKYYPEQPALIILAIMTVIILGMLMFGGGSVVTDPNIKLDY